MTPIERLKCRLADPGCTPAAQTANLGGQLDAILSALGVLFFVAAGFFLASAMKRTPGWHQWVWPTRWVMILVAILVAVDGLLGHATGSSGLLERLLAATGAVGIALLAAGILRRSPGGRPMQGGRPDRPR